MDLTLLPSVVPGGAGDSCQYLSTCIVNRTIALDAGVLGFHGTPQEQAVVGDVFLTHTHLDHVASLPMYLENVYDLRAEPPRIYASAVVLDSLQRDVFNDRLWPDFLTLSQRMRPFLQLIPFNAGDSVVLDGLRVTAVGLNHVVPSAGFLLQDGRATVAFVADTGPSDEIWVQAAACDDLAAVIVETTFPDELAWLAHDSLHLTPALLATELAKLGRRVPTYVMHLKARYRVEVRAQLAALGLGYVHLLEPGRTYTF